MTLKEIYKIIDEADVVYFKENNYSRIAFLAAKGLEKMSVEPLVNKNYVLTYYKLNKETGEMTLLAKVDHIDKEKKIVKKKLDEMTQKEIDKVSARLCLNNTCQECPFSDNNDFKCLDDFLDWKKRYLDNKDKEFDVEVEE